MTPSLPRACAALLAAIAVAIAVGAAGPARAGFKFVDRAAESGVDIRTICGAEPADKRWLSEGMGNGAAWLDYDGDGKLDLYVVNGSTYDRKPGAGEPNRLFKGDGKGGFADVTEKAGVGDRGWGYGVAVGDYDNDGDPDLYVTNFGPNVLYRNDGDGTFTDVTAKSGTGNALFSTAAAWIDYDLDGDLDLYVGNYMESSPDKVPARGSAAADSTFCRYRGIEVACGPLGQTPLPDALYRNEGGDRFVDVSAEAGIALDRPRFTLGVVAGDLDGDGRTDLYVANDSVQNSLWRNVGGGRFEDVGVRSLTALNADGQTQAGMGTDLGDYDGDGRPDIVVTNFAHDLNTIYRNVNGKLFIDDSRAAGLGTTYLALSWGVGFHDFDLDGDLDLFIANGHIYPEVDGFDVGTRYRQPNHLFENAGGRFTEVGGASGPGLALARSFRGAAFADFDDDGDVDVYVTALNDRGALLRNDSPRAGSWLRVRLVGKSANRDGVGAAVTAVVGERRLLRLRTGGGSFLSASDPRLHFGLGSAERVDALEIVWPGGERQVVRGLAADREWTVRQGDDAAR